MEELLNLIYKFEENSEVVVFEDGNNAYINAMEVMSFIARLKYEIKSKPYIVITQNETKMEATSKDEAEMWKEVYKLLNSESQIKEKTKGELKLWNF